MFHGKATGLNVQGLYCPAQAAHSRGHAEDSPTTTTATYWAALWPTYLLAILLSAQLDSLLGCSGKALGTIYNWKVPQRCSCRLFQSWSSPAPWLATCAAYRLCFWAALSRSNCMLMACISVSANRMIAPSSQARAWWEEEGAVSSWG